MAQLGVIQVDERLTGELGRYLQKNFGTSIRWAVKRHRLTGKEVAERACGHILQNYSFPEHPHGFRLYIKHVLRWSPGTGEASYPAEIDAAKDSYTVLESAIQLGVSTNLLYRLIRTGKLHAEPGDDGLKRILRDGFLKVAAYQREKVQRRRRREELQDQCGKSAEAARKAIYRKRGRIPSIEKSTDGPIS